MLLIPLKLDYHIIKISRMKSLKILSLFLVIFLNAANISFAQSEAPSLTDEQKAEMAQKMEEFYKVLNLSEEQKPEFKAITKKYAEELNAVKNSSSGKYKKYKKVKSIQKNKNSEMEALLSEEQYQVYLKQQEEMQKKMKEQRG